MDVPGWVCDTTDHLHYACSLDANGLAFATVLLQGVLLTVGVLIGVAVIIGLNALWSRL